VWLIDEAGRPYLDGSSGAVVTSLGHGNAEIAAALQQQAMKVAFAHRTQFRNRPAEELAAALVDLAPLPLARAALLSPGSEANELAMRLAIRFWQEQGQPRKHGIISRWTSASLNLNEAGPPYGFPRGGGSTLEMSVEESSSAVSVRGSKSREEE
jgi:adenosylmethionine-8-amino-7-oxononanoate aminotransferase